MASLPRFPPVELADTHIYSRCVDDGRYTIPVVSPQVLGYKQGVLPSVFGKSHMSYTSPVLRNDFPDSGQSRVLYNALGPASGSVLAPVVPSAKLV